MEMKILLVLLLATFVASQQTTEVTTPNKPTPTPTPTHAVTTTNHPTPTPTHTVSTTLSYIYTSARPAPPVSDSIACYTCDSNSNTRCGSNPDKNQLNYTLNCAGDCAVRTSKIVDFVYVERVCEPNCAPFSTDVDGSGLSVTTQTCCHKDWCNLVGAADANLTSTTTAQISPVTTVYPSTTPVTTSKGKPGSLSCYVCDSISNKHCGIEHDLGKMGYTRSCSGKCSVSTNTLTNLTFVQRKCEMNCVPFERNYQESVIKQSCCEADWCNADRSNSTRAVADKDTGAAGNAQINHLRCKTVTILLFVLLSITLWIRP